MTATATVVSTAEQALALRGEHLGRSGWATITQEQVDTFADATGDHQWIHVDVKRAHSESPFGGTIAHGFLVLSLIPLLVPEVLAFENFPTAVNYGCDKVRFTAPVRVGSAVRASVGVAEAVPIEGGVQLTLDITFELDGSERPACVASFISRHYGG